MVIMSTNMSNPQPAKSKDTMENNPTIGCNSVSYSETALWKYLKLSGEAQQGQQGQQSPKK